jgi:copper chaperone CopZ
MTMDVEADGAMTITANWQAYQNYGPALVLKNIESKAYYQNLINSGITYLTFDLKVGGEDAGKLDDIHILGSAQKVSACEKVDGVYKVQIQLAHIVQFYDTIITLDTSGNQAGQWGSRSALLLAWRFSTNFATVPTDATRNYIFTISNSMYV